MDLLDLLEGLGGNADACISGWVLRRLVAPVLHENYSRLNQGTQVAIKRSNCILKESTDATWVCLKFD